MIVTSEEKSMTIEGNWSRMVDTPDVLRDKIRVLEKDNASLREDAESWRRAMKVYDSPLVDTAKVRDCLHGRMMYLARREHFEDDSLELEEIEFGMVIDGKILFKVVENGKTILKAVAED